MCPSSTRRLGFTLIELVVSLVLIATIAVVIWSIYLRPGQLERRNSRNCMANLKQFGQSLQMYASEQPEGLYPPMKTTHCDGTTIAGWSGVLDFELLVPAYLPGLDTVAMCPGDDSGHSALEMWDGGENESVHWQAAHMEERLNKTSNGMLEPCEVYGQSYTYTGWALPETFFSMTYTTPEWKPVTTSKTPGAAEVFRANVVLQGTALAKSGEKAAKADWVFDTQGQPDIFRGSTRAPRLGTGVERKLVKDPQDSRALESQRAQVAVMWDSWSTQSWPSGTTSIAIFLHAPGGGNVLYLDGHVEFVKYTGGGSPFPYDDCGKFLQQAMHELYE